MSSSPKHSTGPDFYNLTDDERTNSTNIRENSSNNVIISRKLKRKLPAMENTIITHNRKIHSKSTRIEDEDIIQEESLEKSLQTIKENNQRQIEESIGKLNSSVNTKAEVLLENYSKQIEDWIKPLKQPERDDTTKSEQLIKAKTLNSKNDNKTSKREKGVRESN